MILQLCLPDITQQYVTFLPTGYYYWTVCAAVTMYHKVVTGCIVVKSISRQQGQLKVVQLLLAPYYHCCYAFFNNDNNNAA